MKRQKEAREDAEGPSNRRKVEHREKQVLPPISEIYRKPGLYYKSNGKVRKKESLPPPPPLPPPAKTKTGNRKDNPSSKSQRPFDSDNDRFSRPRITKREASKSVPPLKIKEKLQRQLGNVPPRRSRSQPTRKGDVANAKPAWIKDKQGHKSKKKNQANSRHVENARLPTAKTRRTVLVASSSASDPNSSANTQLEQQRRQQQQQQQQQQLTAKEVEKRKVKKIVDYVYAMDCAYGAISSKFTRISLKDDDDGDDVLRRGGGGGGLRPASRMTSRSRVSYRGLTGILSGRTSAMSDFAASPKTPKLLYGSLVSLRR